MRRMMTRTVVAGLLVLASAAASAAASATASAAAVAQTPARTEAAGGSAKAGPGPDVASARRTVKTYGIEAFMATTSVGGASISHDEKRVLFHSNASGIFNLYTLPIGGGAPTALTRSTTDSHFAVGFFPHDDRVLFTRDQDGDELNHLFVREVDGRERDLTPGKQLKANFHGFSGDGRRFFVSTNERDPRFFDVYAYDAATYERRVLMRNEAGMDIQAVSRDGRWVALGKSRTTADSDVHLFEVDTGRLTHLTPHTGNISHSAATFDPQSRELLMLTDEGGEFTRSVAVNLSTGQRRELDRAAWDVVYTSYSRDGRTRVVGINEDASLVVKAERDGKPLALPKLAGQMRGVTFSRTGRYMVFGLNADRSPTDLHVHDLQTGRTQRLTRSLSPQIDARDLVDARVVRFPSFDGLEIPAIYYQPHGASPTNKVPAVVLVHGGPGGQATRGYYALIQFLVNHGYAVLDINNRGSSGYGKTFFAADDRRHGREPLWDCLEAKQFLAATGVVDPHRIGIMGGSYGGYMVLAALAFRPEAFKVGVDIFGVSNWIRTLESIPPYWESFREALHAEVGDPVKDREFLVATSPLFHAQHIRVPLLVIQGANDPRVIKPESDEIVEAVKKNGVPVEYLVFDDEGHGFSKKKNEAATYARTLAFLDRHLKAAPAPSGRRP